MSKFIEKLKSVSRIEAQPMGFRATKPAATRPQIQLITSLAQETVENLVDYITGSDAVLLRVSNPGTAAKTLQNLSRALPDIIWGAWLSDSTAEISNKLEDTGTDFVVFPAKGTRLAFFQDSKIGKLLELETSLSEGLVRTVNDLPVDAIMVATGEKGSTYLRWQDIMLLKRLASLLTKPLLVAVPSGVTGVELQALWEAGIAGIITELKVTEPGKIGELRKTIDSLTFSRRHADEKVEALLPRVRAEEEPVVEEEEEDE